MPQSDPGNMYDLLADEYYDASHKTCRNFDTTAKLALEGFKPSVPSTGLVLEVGAGRGRAHEFLGVAPDRIVQLDSSPQMLNLQARESCLLRLCADAASIPISGSPFALVVAFLFDPYLGMNFAREVFRVLAAGGKFIGTNPSACWGHPLRDDLKLNRNETRFVDRQGRTQQLTSVLLPHERMKSLFADAGFTDIAITSHSLPSGVTPISADIERSARLSGKTVTSLEIIDLVIATKP